MSARRSADRGRGETLDLFAVEAPPRPRGDVKRTRPSAAATPAAATPAAATPAGPETIPGGDLAGAYDPGRRAAHVERVAPQASDEELYGGVVPGASRRSAVAVSTLTQTAKDVVEGAFMPLWVRGEVSDFKAHRNGHWYFCLRDQVAQVRCVIWSRDAVRLPAAPDDGMQVVALGQPTVYAARGDLQLVIRSLDAQGDGLWRKALERTRARLAADGLLDPGRRRPLPRLPRRVALVTSPDGAALHDIAAVMRRRCPGAELVVVPAKVQGDGAAEELRAAVERVGRWGGADVLIVGRGGGAREDLWAFNDEALARAVAASPIPTISAVGHEVDVTMCDLVADVRAATPSVAAESAVPVVRELRAEIRDLGESLQDALLGRVARARQTLDHARVDLASAATRIAERRRAGLQATAGRLHALSPLATLARGYAVARSTPDGRTLARVADFAPGAPFDLLVADGRVRAAALPEPGAA
ncbi:MAG: exodeoxyribonuclease VII large subunit [Gemmatirosa sp.]|nr:exodeoxyribonuclease VII large subunit [Gemmatirosa sp.]